MIERNKPTGLLRIWRAFGYSISGFKGAYRDEAAFRQEVWMAVILIPAGLWLGQSGVERALLVAAVMLVLVVELLNSGIEAVVDRFGGEHHELSGLAKDMGSAAVLLSLVMLAVVWGLVLFG